MKLHKFTRVVFLLFTLLALSLVQAQSQLHVATIFSEVSDHVHGSTIVELPNGDLLAAWFQGDGERTVERLAIMGSRLRHGNSLWDEPFLMADMPDFPEQNPVLFLDQGNRLWLVWYTIIAHQSETSLIKYRTSERYSRPGAPQWDWQEILHVKPGDPSQKGIQPNDRFSKAVERQLNLYRSYLIQNQGKADHEIQDFHAWAARVAALARGTNMIRQGFVVEEGNRIPQELGYPYFRRMGWQTRNKPTILSDGRILLPLYSDGFDFSLIAITDDRGKSWTFSEPLVGMGNIQPTILEKANGTLVAYMRDNGPPPKRLHVSQSTDRGKLWSPVQDSTLLNPGSGADSVRLQNGHWVIAYNDTEQGRPRLAISLSTDEGQSWVFTRHLERDDRSSTQMTRSHYPAIIQGKNGSLHLSYSYHRRNAVGQSLKTIKYARFGEDWIKENP